jgi:hypothetical protein
VWSLSGTACSGGAGLSKLAATMGGTVTLRLIVCLFVMLQAASSSQAQAQAEPVLADSECKLFKVESMYRETRNYARGYLAGIIRAHEVTTGEDVHSKLFLTDLDQFVYRYCELHPQENVSVAVEELFKRVMQRGRGK